HQIVTLGEVARIDSDIIFITTQDSEIVAAAASLSGLLAGSPVVLHTSGSYPSSILDGLLSSTACVTGSLHPLVSISKPDVGPERFRTAFFCVEGSPEAVSTASDI